MSIETLLTQWGLPAVFIGCLVEGEGAAFLGGVLAHRRLFSFEAAALAASAGGFLADQTFFHIGRHASRFAFAQRILDKPALQRVLTTLRQRPLLSCLGLRFFYGLKTVGAVGLGAAGVAPLTFAALNLVSVLAWGHLVTALGYGAGKAIENAFGRLELHHHLGLSLSLLVAVLALAEVIRRRRRK